MATYPGTVNDEQRWSGEQLLLRIGAVGAVVGTVLQVAAGTSQTAQLGTADLALASLAGQQAWVWPLIYLAFIVGALFWVGALMALAMTLTGGVAWALVRLALAAAIVGVTLHVVDGVFNAAVLEGVARDWVTAPAAEQAALLQQGDLVLRIREGTWAGVITLYHGLPFVLAGLAVAASRSYPAWLGWIGFLGGAGSLVVGLAIIFGAAPAGLAVPFAVVLSVFMVVLGWQLWTRAEAVRMPDAAEPRPA